MHWYNCILQRLHGPEHEQDESHAQLSLPHCGAGQSTAAGIYDQVGHIYIYHISKSMYDINPLTQNTFLSTSEQTIPHCTAMYTMPVHTQMNQLYHYACVRI